MQGKVRLSSRAGLGLAWRGRVGRGQARSGKVRHNSVAGRGDAWLGEARLG